MRVVLTHGCWDLLHVGHLEHFKEARAMGDRLVVSVSPDSIVRRKGSDRPIIPMSDRMRMVEALKVVDEVWGCWSEDASAAIVTVKPTLFVQGIDYAESGPTMNERAACKSVGATWAHTKSPKGESTTSLIRRIKLCGY